MRGRLDKIYTKAVDAIGSRWMLVAIIIIFILQSLWIAFSFRYPMVYDESFHFPVIQIFSHELDPFITEQPPAYDTYGDLQYSNSVFYHYLMSWPYRLIDLFTQYEPYQVVVLRVINVLMAAAGLLVFARLFRQIKIKPTYINTGLLVFTLLPIVPFVAAHISYDNLLLLLTAGYLLFATKIIQDKNIIWSDYAWLITIGCFAALVKFTFLPIFAASVLFLVGLLFKRYGRDFIVKMLKSFQASTGILRLITTTAMVLFISLFSITYIAPTVEYGSPTPSCFATMSKDRCMTGRNGQLIERGSEAKATKAERPGLALPIFTQNWINNMTTLTNSTGSTYYQSGTFAKTVPLVTSVVFFGVFVGAGVLLYSWRSLRKNYSWYFLVVIAIALLLAVYYTNLTGYLETHQFLANQPRYLLSVVPIVTVMIVAAAAYAFRNHGWIKLGIFATVLLLLTQGGGVTTHILRSDDSWYWQNSTVIEANHKAKAILRPLVKEN